MDFRHKISLFTTLFANLNVIERLWKWMKKKTLYAQYYQNFHAFKAALIETIQTAKQKHPPELKTLLNLKFQTF